MPSATLTYDDLLGMNNVSHVYQVVAVNSCGRRGGGSSRTAADLVAFGVGCETDSTSVYWGSLPVTSSHSWTNQQCGNATTGTVTFSSASPDLFFVVVGANTEGFEGSYGLDSDDAEIDPKSGGCATYDLGNVCN